MAKQPKNSGLQEVLKSFLDQNREHLVRISAQEANHIIEDESVEKLDVKVWDEAQTD